MSMALQDVIPIMELMSEINERHFKVICSHPQVYCKVFEDYFGAPELVHLPKLHPRTKHINICYPHFRECLCLGIIKTLPISTDDQIADALTKPIAQNSFCRHCKYFCAA
eukprot:CCRYP_000957-RA/>CCRYP_000957-RA protein AED:0.33 eAED:0.33 QI:0/-1/0/1/-1/0/1/0/109